MGHTDILSLERRTHEALDALLAMAEVQVMMPTSPSPDSAPALFMTGELAHRLLGLTCQVMGCEEAILVRDPQSRIVFWNQGAEQLYGWRPEEVIGQITHVLLATRFPDSRETVDHQLEEQGRWEGVLTHLRRDGTPVIVESRQVMDRVGAPRP